MFHSKSYVDDHGNDRTKSTLKNGTMVPGSFIKTFLEISYGSYVPFLHTDMQIMWTPCRSLQQPFFWTSDQGSKEDRQVQDNDGRSNRQRYLTSNQDTVQSDVKLTNTQSSYSSPPDM